MKELIIARHAKSSWKNLEILDVERPLNRRGYTDANTVGKYLRLKKVNPDILITSPAVRAFSTATIYARHLEFDSKDFKVDNRLYHGSMYDIELMLSTLPAKINKVMIFGHNPTFTDLANHYTNANIDNVPTSGIVAINFQIAGWEEIKSAQGEVAFFQYPKKLVF